MDRALLELVEKTLDVPLEEVERLNLTWPRERGLFRLELEVSRGTRLHFSSNVGRLEGELPILLRAARAALERLPGPGRSLWMELVRTDGETRLHLGTEGREGVRVSLVVKGGEVQGLNGLPGEEALLEAARVFREGGE